MSPQEMYESGLSLRKISAQTEIPYSTLRELLIAQGVKMRQRGSGNDNRTDHKAIQQTAFLYEKMGLSAGEIAEHFGMTHSAIINRLKRHGTPRRSRGESIKLRLSRRPR